MKSKMKSTFAIIAVALMVLVAVVPMIGVFTSDSNAEIVPIETSDKIVISGTVYKVDGSKGIAANHVVKVTWGSGLYYQYSADINTTSGAYSITLDETQISEAILTVWSYNSTTNIYTQDTEFSEVKLTNLKSEGSQVTYTADLKAGYQSSANPKVQFAGAGDNYLLTAIFDNGKAVELQKIPVSFTYSLYAGASKDTATEISGSLATYYVQGYSKLSTSIQYPYGYTYISPKITSLTVGNDTMSVNSALLTSTMTTSQQTLVLDKYILKVTSNLAMPMATLTIDGATSIYSDKVGESSAYNIAFFYTSEAPSATASEIKAKASWGSFSDSEGVALGGSSSYGLTYTPSGRYYGVVGMGITGANLVYADNSQSLTITYGATGIEESLPSVYKNNYYITSGIATTSVKFKVSISGGYNIYKFGTSELDLTTQVSKSATTLSAGVQNVEVRSATDTTNGFIGYQLVTITAEANISAVISGATNVFGISYSSSSKSGNIDLSTTATKLYVEKNSVLKVTPNDASVIEYTTGTSEVQVANDPIVLSIVASKQTMTLAFTDGDGNALAKTDGVTVSYRLPGQTAFTALTAGVYTKNDIEAHVDMTKIDLYFSYTDATAGAYIYSFAAMDKYTCVKYQPVDDVMTVASLDKTYEVTLKDSNGNVIKNAAITQAELGLKVYSAFINESGYTIFRDVTQPSIKFTASASNSGPFKYMISSVYMDKTITTTATKMATFLPTLANYVWDTVPTAAKADMVVKANVDQLSGTLYRSIGVAGSEISGIQVDLYYKAAGDTTADAIVTGGTSVSTAVTASDGSFTLTTAKKVITHSNTTHYYALKFSTGQTGYTVPNALVVDSDDEKIDTYKATVDKYTITVKDADESALLFSTATKIYGFGSDVATINAYKSSATASIALVPGDVYDLKLVSDYASPTTTVYRTFAQYTVSEEEAISGKISLTTQQSAYLIELEDAYGLPITTGMPNVFYRVNGAKVESPDKTVPSTGIVATSITKAVGTIYKTLVDGVYVAYLTDLSDDDEGAYYLGANTNDQAYKFLSTKLVKFVDNKAEIESEYAKIGFIVTDAAGNQIDLSVVPSTAAPGGTYTAVKAVDSSSNEFALTLDSVSSVLTMIADPDELFTLKAKAYVVTSADAQAASYTGFTIKATTMIIDGEIAADETAVAFSVVDALGLPITDAKATIVAYDAAGLPAGALATTEVLSATGMITKVFDTSLYAAYAIALYDNTAAADAKTYYTFDKITGTVFVADQCSIVPTFATANGYGLNTDVKDGTTVRAYSATGAEIGRAGSFAVANNVITATPLIVDVEEAAYYKITAGGVDKYTFDESETPVFVANESYITGTVPYSGKGTGSATLELYLEGNMVKEMKNNVNIVDKYYYEAILDLSGYIGDTAAVVFDSIIVVYYENGVELGYAAVDPYTAVNNIVTPEVEVYVAVLDAPSALISRHVSIAQVGNTATVSADGQFIVADDDAIYTDGQYIYTFAGWYVDNEKVSSAPSFTFSLTENVVIVPEYTVKYEKISDANAQVDPEIIIEEITKENTGIDTNVLIIGIAAVIVALIAVVYAVIKKE